MLTVSLNFLFLKGMLSERTTNVFCVFSFKDEVVNSDCVFCVVKNTGKPLCSFEDSAFLFCFVLFCFLWPHLAAFGILVPQPGIEPLPPCSGSMES